jgi:hypothetical protein
VKQNFFFSENLCCQTLTQQKQLKAGITTYFSILTLNANGFNSSIKRHQLASWIKKEEPDILLFARNPPYR